MTETLTWPTDRDVLAPSGKGAADENFPVGSRLIAACHRPAVIAYYAFARGADDIADHPGLAPADKIARLDALEAGLAPGARGPETATRLRDLFAEAGLPPGVASDLLVAFRRDALKLRTRDWADLMEYCAYSAHPVGRFLLHLHGEAPETLPASDALCAALQVLNHLQDIAEDFRALGRLYLPGDWLAEAGVPDPALTAPAASPGLRRVIDRCLDGTDGLLIRAAPLPGLIRDRRMAAEAAAILALARSLARRLRRQDPLAARVAHRPLDLALAALSGLVRLARP